MIARENWGGTMMNGKPVGCCDCVQEGFMYAGAAGGRRWWRKPGIDDIRAIYSQQGIQAGAV